MNNDKKEDKTEIVDFSDKIKDAADKFVNTPDRTNNFDNKEKESYKSYALMSYIFLLFIVPMYKKLHKNSKYLLFHVNQGISLSMCWIAVFLVTGLLRSLFVEVYGYSSYTPGWVSFVMFIMYSIVVIINIIGIVNAYNGKSRELPIIGKYRFIK